MKRRKSRKAACWNTDHKRERELAKSGQDDDGAARIGSLPTANRPQDRRLGRMSKKKKSLDID